MNLWDWIYNEFGLDLLVGLFQSGFLKEFFNRLLGAFGL